MIFLDMVIDKFDVLSKMIHEGVKPKRIVAIMRALEEEGVDEIEVGMDEKDWFMIVKVGDCHGVSKRFKDDEWNGFRGFMIALMRALGVK